MATPDNSRISRETVSKAAAAILQWLRDHDSKPQLLDHDDFLYLQLAIHRFPSHLSKSPRVSPRLLPLPHPLFSDRQPSSLCLFFDDRSPSASASASALLDRARAFSLPVDTAIGLSSLRSDYRPYEARRRLCDSHDLFFADRRVVPLLPRFIGKEFFRKKKAPLPLDLSRPGWPQQLRRCLNSAFLHPPCKGTCAVVKVGRVSMTPEEIADNVVAVVEGAVEHVPKGWANLRSVLVKAVDSVALPIYQAVPQMGMKIDVQALLTAVGKGEDLKHGDEDEDGDVVDDEEVDVQFSSQKKKQKKGRIHELLTGYMEMVEKGDDTVDVSLDENVKAGTDDEIEVEKIAIKKRKKKEGKMKGRKEVSKKKGKKDRSSKENRNDNDDFIAGEEGGALAVDRPLNMKRKKGKADRKVNEESDSEHGKKVNTTEKKIKKKSKVRQT